MTDSYLLDRSGKALNGNPSLSSKLLRPESSIRQSTWSTVSQPIDTKTLLLIPRSPLLFQLRENSSSYASIDSSSAPPIEIDIPFPTFELDSTYGSPPAGHLPFQLRDDSSTYAPDDSPGAPSSVGIDVTFPTFDLMQSKKKDKLPATVDAKLRQLYGIETQPHPINPFLPMRMSLHSNYLSPILQPLPDDALNKNAASDGSELLSSTNFNPHQYPAAPDSSQHHPDTISKSLEHHLKSALVILIQTSGILADGVTPQARNTLKAINALVSTETPTYDPLPFKVARKAVKWLQTLRSPR